MEGLTLRELQEVASDYAIGNKGEVGDRIERAFGLARGGHGADFPVAGIELKSTELTKRAAGWSVRWRTSVGMINIKNLPKETWDAATIRKKLSKILFIFYKRGKGQVPDQYLIDLKHLWEPSTADWVLIKADWEQIRQRVINGERQSEGFSRVLGAATKGTRDSATRAFSLKRPFVDSIYQEARGTLSLSVPVPAGVLPEDAVVEFLRRFVGWTIGDLARHIQMKDTSAKHLSALAVWGSLGARSRNERIKQLDDAGITRRIVPIRPNGSVLDPTSMKGFLIDELSEERWDDSMLRESIERILFVPLHGAVRNGDQRHRVVGRAFLWSPTAAERAGIEREWQIFHDHAASGRILAAPAASQTRYIHVRTKGRDSSDIDPGSRSAVPRRGFYLNGQFVTRIVADHEAP